MSVDLEKYAEFYARLGDGDIQKLLQKAAKLSRRRGRPEVVYIDSPLAFSLRENRFVREIEHRLEVQKEIVRFFTDEAPIGSQKTLSDIAQPFHKKVGSFLPHEMPIGDLLLPARARTSEDREEKLLLQASQNIAPGVKSMYNKLLQTCMRAGLVRIGEVRNVATLDGEFIRQPMTPRSANFFRVAF